MNENGFDTKAIRADITAQEEKLKDQHSSMIEENSTQYGAVKTYNEMEGKRIQDKTDKYEEDRIGHGRTSKMLGGAANLGTFGNAVWGIGGSDKYSDLDYNHSSKLINSGNVSSQQKDRDSVPENNNLNSLSKSNKGFVDPSAYEKAIKNKLDEN